MGDPRLYYGPEITVKVLRHVIKGSTTQEELAEAMGVTVRTVHNRVHDPAALGLIERHGGEYEISDNDDVMKFFQLKDRTVLKERFVELPGVAEVRDELNGGRLSFERIGRLISHHTNSQAIEPDTFVNYGRTYAKWFDYLRMGYSGNKILYSERPPDSERRAARGPNSAGSGYPKVRPVKVFQALPIIEQGIENKEELADQFEFSDRWAGKLLSTCYSLGLAEREMGEITLTDFGKKVLNAEGEQRKALIRKALINVDLVEKYVEQSPDNEFKNQDILSSISNEYNKDWSDSTIQTKAKRLYRWLVYSRLYTEVKQGVLVRNASVNGIEWQGGQESVEDYV